MNRDDIIRMARKSGFAHGICWAAHEKDLLMFAALVAAATLKNSVMTDEEYEQAMADEGQRRMLEIDTEVRAMIEEAVAAEREACAKICEEPWQGHPYGIAKQIRARGNDAA